MAWLRSLSCQFRRYGREDTRLGRARSRAESDPLADRAEPKHGRSGWRVIADLRSRRPRSGNASMGEMVAEVECHRCKTRASIPLDAIPGPRDTPIWKLEVALKCRSCRTPRYSPPVRMIKLTQQRELTPYVWVHSDEER
jgi:hypothetical protein